MSKGVEVLADDSVLEKLAFQRGILALLKDTGLCGIVLDKAIVDLDELIDQCSKA
jgi:hypothetical protein